MGFLDIASSVLSGGVTGIIGAAITRYADHESEKLKLKALEITNKHNLESKQIDLQIMKQEWEMRDKIATTEAESRMDVADSQAFAASYSYEPKSNSNSKLYTKNQNWLMVILDFLSGAVRPGASYWSLFIMSYLLYRALNMSIAPATSDAAYSEVIQNLLFTTSTIITWWFGTRPRQK